MRRASAIIVFTAILVLLAGAVGCGGEKSGANLSPAGDVPAAAEILAAVMTAGETMASMTADFDVAVTIDADTSQLSGEEKAMLGNPIKVSGALAAADKPFATDADVALAMMGQTTEIAIKVLGDKAWLGFAGQWYEAPAQMLGMMGQDAQSEPDMAKVMQMVNDLGIDPATWMKGLRVLGEETIDGAATYHLSGSPDMARMMADAIELTKSPEFMALVDPSGTMTGMMGSGTSRPSADELQTMQTQIAEMFKDFTLDLWVDKATSVPRKIALVINITPPPGDDAQGVNGAGITATILLRNLNQPVTVEAPASALPFSDLQKALLENPALLGPLSGALGGMPTF